MATAAYSRMAPAAVPTPAPSHTQPAPAPPPIPHPAPPSNDPFVVYELRKPSQRGGAVVPRLRHNPGPSPANYRFARVHAPPIIPTPAMLASRAHDPSAGATTPAHFPSPPLPKSLEYPARWDDISLSSHSTKTSILSSERSKDLRGSFNTFMRFDSNSADHLSGAVFAPVPLRRAFHLPDPSSDSSAPASASLIASSINPDDATTYTGKSLTRTPVPGASPTSVTPEPSPPADYGRMYVPGTPSATTTSSYHTARQHETPDNGHARKLSPSEPPYHPAPLNAHALPNQQHFLDQVHETRRIDVTAAGAHHDPNHFHPVPSVLSQMDQEELIVDQLLARSSYGNASAMDPRSQPHASQPMTSSARVGEERPRSSVQSPLPLPLAEAPAPRSAQPDATTYVNPAESARKRRQTIDWLVNTAAEQQAARSTTPQSATAGNQPPIAVGRSGQPTGVHPTGASRDKTYTQRGQRRNDEPPPNIPREGANSAFETDALAFTSASEFPGSQYRGDFHSNMPSNPRHPIAARNANPNLLSPAAMMSSFDPTYATPSSEGSVTPLVAPPMRSAAGGLRMSEPAELGHAMHGSSNRRGHDGHSDYSDPHATELDVYCQCECTCIYEAECRRHCGASGSIRSGTCSIVSGKSGSHASTVPGTAPWVPVARRAHGSTHTNLSHGNAANKPRSNDTAAPPALAAAVDPAYGGGRAVYGSTGAAERAEHLTRQAHATRNPQGAPGGNSRLDGHVYANDEQQTRRPQAQGYQGQTSWGTAVHTGAPGAVKAEANYTWGNNVELIDMNTRQYPQSAKEGSRLGDSTSEHRDRPRQKSNTKAATRARALTASEVSSAADAAKNPHSNGQSSARVPAERTVVRRDGRSPGGTTSRNWSAPNTRQVVADGHPPVRSTYVAPTAATHAYSFTEGAPAGTTAEQAVVPSESAAAAGPQLAAPVKEHSRGPSATASSHRATQGGSPYRGSQQHDGHLAHGHGNRNGNGISNGNSGGNGHRHGHGHGNAQRRTRHSTNGHGGRESTRNRQSAHHASQHGRRKKRNQDTAPPTGVVGALKRFLRI